MQATECASRTRSPQGRTHSCEPHRTDPARWLQPSNDEPTDHGRREHHDLSTHGWLYHLSRWMSAGHMLFEAAADVSTLHAENLCAHGTSSVCGQTCREQPDTLEVSAQRQFSHLAHILPNAGCPSGTHSLATTSNSGCGCTTLNFANMGYVVERALL